MKTFICFLLFCLYVPLCARPAFAEVPLKDAAGPGCDTFLLKDGSVLYGRIQSKTTVFFKIKPCNDTALVATTVNKDFVKEIRYFKQSGVRYDTLVLNDGRIIAARISFGDAKKIAYRDIGNEPKTIQTKAVRAVRSDKFRLREGRLERIGETDPANWKWSPSLLSGVLSGIVVGVGIGAQYDLFLLRAPKFKIAIGAQAAYLSDIGGAGSMIKAGPKFFIGSKRSFFIASAQYFYYKEQIYNKYREKGLYASAGIAYRANPRLFIIPALDLYFASGKVWNKGASFGVGFNF